MARRQHRRGRQRTAPNEPDHRRHPGAPVPRRRPHARMLTFPSNPINFTAPAARSAGDTAAVPVVEPFTVDGQTFGLGDPAKPDAEQPDFIAAFTDTGEQGFVRTSDLATEALDPDAAKALPVEGDAARTPSRAITVYAADGATQLGTLTTS